jgi:DNA mismatch repair protein MLH3
VGDDYIPWHNPATKETVMINSRTGVLRPNASLASSDENMLHAWGQRRIAKRLRISRPDEAIRSPSPWLNKILESWDNEVFLPAETAIPQVAPDVGDATSSSVLHGYRHHCTQLDIDRAFKDCGAGIASGKISKKGLREAKVLSQVEKQFILVEVDETLILIDQHAADERVRIEQLLSDLVRPCNLSKDDIQRLTAGAHVRSGIETCALDGGLRFEVDRKEAALFTQHIQHFADWGILYYIRRGKATLGVDKDTLVLTALPPGIIARCTLEPKLAIEMLRREVWEFQEKGRAATPTVSTEACEEQTHRRHTWVNRIQGCPQGILALLNSRSCRSAIMFNDELSVPECEELISRLSGCAFPFQCAHGRPDLAPLVELGSLTPWAGDVEYIGLGETLSRWTKEQITPRSC